MSRPLSRRQKQMLRAFLVYERLDTPPGFSSQWHAPCPRIGDLRVLAGLCSRKLMEIADHEIGYVPSCWPRWQRLTEEGRRVALELEAALAVRTI